MRNRTWILVVLLALSTAAGCITDASLTESSTGTAQPTAVLDRSADGSTPTCPSADGQGSISPEISIYSITFVVNGVEQVIHEGDALQVSPGDQVQVREADICIGDFAGDGGGACVDLTPLDESGQEVDEHMGTHMISVSPGTITNLGPDQVWTISEEWSEIFVVVNHWVPETSQDLECANGLCERDDWIFVELQSTTGS